MKKELLIFGFALAGVATCLQFLDYSYFTQSIGNELYVTILGLIFLIGGFWLAKQYFIKPKSETKESIDRELASKLDLSERETEVLNGINKGLSNQEIGSELFISESTVKTHIGNLFSKLEVKRRTQAIQKARALHLID